MPCVAEQMSALVDGQLHGAELEQALMACEKDEAVLNRWHDYHLVGDVMRGTSLQIRVKDASFIARLRPALRSSEPVLVRPLRQAFAQEAAAPRWRWTVGFASLVLLAGVTWSLLSGATAGDDGLATDAPPILASSSEGVTLRDAALGELMEAHRQQAGVSVLPMPSGFLGNATFDAKPAGVGHVSTR